MWCSTAFVRNARMSDSWPTEVGLDAGRVEGLGLAGAAVDDQFLAGFVGQDQPVFVRGLVTIHQARLRR